jgi:hypothetical protein
MATKPKAVVPQTPNKDAEFENLLQLIEKHQKEVAADPEFDLYEKVDGNYVWRAVSIGLGRALHRFKELSASSTNELVLMHTFSGKVITRLNAPRP